MSDAVRSRVVQDDDLPEVDARAWLHRRPDSGPCGPVDDAEDNLFEDVSDDEWGIAQVELAGGDLVLSGVADRNGSSYATDRVDALGFAIDDCEDLDAGGWTFTVRRGLPDGAVGYRSVEEIPDIGAVTIDRVAASAGDWVVLVGVRRDGDEPATDVLELLDAALRPVGG